jgi:hypothetical protein
MARPRNAQRESQESFQSFVTHAVPRCIAYKDDCHYDKPPSLAYVRSLEEEVQELKTQLRQARAQGQLRKASEPATFFESRRF